MSSRASAGTRSPAPRRIDVAGDDLAPRQFHPCAVAEHGRGRRDLLLESPDGSFRPERLPGIDAGAEENDTGDDRRLGDFAEQGRAGAGEEQDEHQRVCRPAQYLRDLGRHARACERVRSRGLQPFPRVVAREARLACPQTHEQSVERFAAEPFEGWVPRACHRTGMRDGQPMMAEVFDLRATSHDASRPPQAGMMSG